MIIKKTVSYILAVTFAFGVLYLSTGIGVYLDIPTILVCIGLPILLLGVNFSFCEIGCAFKSLFGDDHQEIKELKKALHFFQSAQRYIIIASLFAVSTGLIFIIAKLQLNAKIGPYVAISLLSLFVMVFTIMFTTMPAITNIKRKMIKSE